MRPSPLVEEYSPMPVEAAGWGALALGAAGGHRHRHHVPGQRSPGGARGHAHYSRKFLLISPCDRPGWLEAPDWREPGLTCCLSSSGSGITRLLSPLNNNSFIISVGTQNLDISGHYMILNINAVVKKYKLQKQPKPFVLVHLSAWASLENNVSKRASAHPVIRILEDNGPLGHCSQLSILIFVLF